MKGRRLPVVLRPTISRPLMLALTGLLTLFFPCAFFAWIYLSPEENQGHRAWIVAILLGGFGIPCLVEWVRLLVRWLVAGETRVEISKEPVVPGEALDYVVTQERDRSRLIRLDARIVCRRQLWRHPVEEIVSLPLGSASPDGPGGRAELAGRVEMPPDALANSNRDPVTVDWRVLVRAEFDRGRVVTVDYPFRVEGK